MNRRYRNCWLILPLLLALTSIGCTEFGRWDLIADPLPPVISTFALTSATPTDTQQITFQLQGGDNVRISHWLLRESPQRPPATDPQWSILKPDTFDLSGGFGEKTVYAWAKDDAGNVSNPAILATEVYFDKSDWTHRVPVHVSEVYIDEALADFPVYFDLSHLNPTDFFAHVQDDGSDLVVTASDGTTPLARELVSLDKPGTGGELWFKAPALSPAAGGDFYIYFGNAVFVEVNNPDLWSNGYAAVWHLEESGSGDAGEYRDSTVHGNHGTAGGGNADSFPARTAGALGAAQQFFTVASVGDYIEFADNPSVTIAGDVTYTFWLKQVSTVNGGRVFEKANGPFIWFTNNPDNLEFSYPRTVSKTFAIRNGYTNASFQHIAITYNGAEDRDAIRMYRNGYSGFPFNGNDGEGLAIDEPTGIFRIGGATFTTNRCINGTIDEFRIAGVIRPPGWIESEFHNQSSPGLFCLVGLQETAF